MDHPPTECIYVGHTTKEFPQSDFARHQYGWEHLKQEIPHLSDGRTLIDPGEAEIEVDESGL